MEIIRTEGGSVMLHNRKSQAFSVTRPLQEILRLHAHEFVRISKSAIVNIHLIDHVS